MDGCCIGAGGALSCVSAFAPDVGQTLARCWPNARPPRRLPVRRRSHAITQPQPDGRTGPRPPARLYQPGNLRPRSRKHFREDLGLLRTRITSEEARRLPHAADRPPADGDGARQGHESARPLQPLPAPRRRAVRQHPRQYRQQLCLLVPRLELPPRRQDREHPADEGLRRHAHDARQPGLQHEGRRARRLVPRLCVRQPLTHRPVLARFSRRSQNRV